MNIFYSNIIERVFIKLCVLPGSANEKVSVNVIYNKRNIDKATYFDPEEKHKYFVI